jgi:Domain of unknown function DUF29
MEELLELRRSLEMGQYDDAMVIINDMEEMARKDKINKIGSFLEVLLLHLIKHHAEGRMTRSWQRSIRNAVYAIQDTNERDSAHGVYCESSELQELIEQRFRRALQNASDEAFEGKYVAKQLATIFDAEAVKAQALDYILNGYPESED